MNNSQWSKTHNVVHSIHLTFVELQLLGIIVLGFTNFNESLIKKFITTLELRDVHIKGSPFLNNRPLNLVSYDLFNVGYNIKCIIIYYIIILILQECVIHDYVVMFHLHDEVES
jgi:hypothetical protein